MQESQLPPEGTVTVLFADVEGSTTLFAQSGDTAARLRVARVERTVRDRLSRHSGILVKSLGDGVMLAFPSARRAVDFAIDLQRSLERENLATPEDRVRLRVGLHTGEVIRERSDLFGSTVNAAARIQSAAEPGQILISSITRALIGTTPDIYPLKRGDVALKGFAEPWTLFEIPWQSATTTALAADEETPFVARLAERRQIREALDAAERGAGATFLLSGEPGIGKTRLASQVAAEARDRGFLVLDGHCYQGGVAAPYAPIAEILEQLVGRLSPEDREAIIGDAAAQLMLAAPRTERVTGSAGRPVGGMPGLERHYVMAGITDIVARAAAYAPLMLLIDDLQWADESSLLLFEQLARRALSLPLVILATVDGANLAGDHALHEAVTRMLQRRDVSELRLERLDHPAVVAMLRALAGTEPPPAIARMFVDEADGNPFFVEELFRHLVEAGTLFDPRGGWFPVLEVAEDEVPRNVAMLIQQRVARLSGPCRDALSTAAIAGRTVPWSVLEAITSLNEQQLLAAVEEAERALIVRTGVELGEITVTFVHEMVRQTLVSQTSVMRRQHVHLRVADALEARRDAYPDEDVRAIAYHLAESGSLAPRERAVPFLARAADAALASGAHEDVIRLARRALDRIDRGDAQTRGQFLYRRGLAHRGLAMGEAMSADWGDALRCFMEAEDHDATALVHTEMMAALMWAGQAAPAIEIARQALSAVEPSDPEIAIGLYAVAGIAHVYSRAPGDGLPLVMRARAIADASGQPRLLGIALMYEAIYYHSTSNVDADIETGRRALEYRADLSPWHALEVLGFLAMALLRAGRLDEVDACHQQATELARFGHINALRDTRLASAAAAYMRTGEISGLARAAEEDVQLCTERLPQWLYFALITKGLVELWRGDAEQAMRHFMAAQEAEPPPHSHTGAWSFIALGHALLGHRTEALALIEEHRHELPVAGDPGTYGARMALISVARAVAVLGEREEAARLRAPLSEALASGDRVAPPWDAGLLSRIAAMVAHTAGDLEDAERLFRIALREADELPFRSEQPETRRWFAPMLLDRARPGDDAEARQLVVEATQQYREIGMAHRAEDISAYLDEMDQ
jgi:class 3 adenylate cyclase/tetratricopeptide (TPR) repeat protein